MQQTKPDPKVTEILAKIIRNNADFWKTLANEGITLEDVKSIPVPTENVERDKSYTHRLEDDGLLKEAIDYLGVTRSTNCMAYGPRSKMDWHTNTNREGLRTYYSFTVKPGRFIYIHPETGQMIVDTDQVGWTVRQFEIRKDKPLWHCVWADGVRFSFGFTEPLEEVS